MESLKINKINKTVSGNVQITGSKSETNRLLILQQYYPNLKIENISNSDDSVLMQKALTNSSFEINIGHAGTTMRFLTSYYSVKENSEIVLTGSGRMKDRPIKILVDALKSLGADIEYLEKEGYPPLKITGKKLTKDFVEIDGNVSSQYISSLLLMAPTLQNGLKLKFKGEVTSIPYIKMTLTLLAGLGIGISWDDDTITIQPKPSIEDKTVVVESDWSSASYYYGLVALSPNSEVTLSAYKKNSLQGDSVLAEIYKNLGVETVFGENSVTLRNFGEINPSALIDLNLISAPDIAQTIVVTCFGLGIECYLTGLHTLKIKETDRLVALQEELEKLGADISVTDKSLHLKAGSTINKDILIKTYDDHRMAMAFAPLALKVPIQIDEAEVVSKSYTDFWADFESVLVY